MALFSYLKLGLGDTRHGTIRLMNTSEDRRRRRSPDPLVALHYQLSQARRDAALDTLVVADGSGVVVAGAGSWASCEELAAFAPLMFDGAMSDERVSIRSVNVGIGRVLLCAKIGDSESAETKSARELAMKRAEQGITRILQAA
jgi:hypothetical protein